MSSPLRFASALAPLAAIALGGCTTGFSANVARFQAMPAPSGQTFTIQPADQRLAGGLEFSQYAALVTQRLAQFGYQPAAGAAGATLVVTLGYGVDHGRERVTTFPGYGPGWGYGPGFGPYGYGGLGFGYGRFGRFGRFGGFGFGDPFFDDFGYPDVESYTVYSSHLDMQIRRTADGQSLFEGHARAISRDDNLPHLVPNLIYAMFTGFPGRSGETVRITIPVEGQGGPQQPKVTPLPNRPMATAGGVTRG